MVVAAVRQWAHSRPEGSMSGRAVAVVSAARSIARWRARGADAPPPAVVKAMTIRRYGRRHGVRTLVETGTYLGDTLWRLRRDFDRLHSIEISEELWRAAVERFRDEPQVTLHRGDSGVLLDQILADLREPAVFWLDGHYSGGVTGRGDVDTPIVAELRSVLRHDVPGHVILVDDARAFPGANPRFAEPGADYPTIDEVRALVAAASRPHDVSIASDIIRIVPR